MGEEKKTYRIAAVVVTFNRLTLLQECIASLRKQTRKLDEIIVINNSSTDGTIEWLNDQKDLTVITQKNSGSAGGQYTGIKTAYEKGYDWIWCMDTDVVPNLDALEMFLKSEVIMDEKVAFLSSTIFYSDGSLCYINLPYMANTHSVLTSLLKFSSLSILSSSFGSVLFSRKAIAEVGYPLINFFIWGDDVEFTFRMIESNFKGFLILSSHATHYAPDNAESPFTEMDYRDSKSFYCVRNTLYIIKLRNQIFNHSKLKGVFACFYFYFSVILKYSAKNNWNIISFVLFTKYFLYGLFYDPRKFLKNKND